MMIFVLEVYVRSGVLANANWIGRVDSLVEVEIGKQPVRNRGWSRLDVFGFESIFRKSVHVLSNYDAENTQRRPNRLLDLVRWIGYRSPLIICVCKMLLDIIWSHFSIVPGDRY